MVEVVATVPQTAVQMRVPKSWSLQLGGTSRGRGCGAFAGRDAIGPSSSRVGSGLQLLLGVLMHDAGQGQYATRSR
jgi:hypothetical protein